MGTNQSTNTHQRSNSVSCNPPQRKQTSLFDPGCLGCFPNPDRVDFNIDNAELQTHNKELVPKGKVSQASIAYLSKEEIGFLKACSGRNISALRYYMNKGTNVNLLDEDRTSPLHVACRSGSLQVVEELINWGAAVNIADMAGWTPLHIAAHHSRPLICHLMLKKGADPYLTSRNGETPWDLAKDKKTEEIFYVHLDRTDLKKMEKCKVDDPFSEIIEENIWITEREKNVKAFQNKLGVDLRMGGMAVEEEKCGESAYLSTRRYPENIQTDSRIYNSTNNLTQIPETSKENQLSNTNRTLLMRNSENYPMGNILSLSSRRENISLKESKKAQKMKQKKEESLGDISNGPKKHRYYSHFRKMKALQMTSFHQNKEALCTLESDDSNGQENSEYSMNNISSSPEDLSVPQRGNTHSQVIEVEQEEMNLTKTTKNMNPTMKLNPSSQIKKKTTNFPEHLKPCKDSFMKASQISSNNKASLPPYRDPKQFPANLTNFSSHGPTFHNRHISRDNSMMSIHTRRSSVSGIEKTNVSGWSFMLSAPVLSIHKLVTKDSYVEQPQKNTYHENVAVVRDTETFVDLEPFKIEPKFMRSVYNVGVQIFNHDSIKGLAFMFLFKQLRKNPKEIALFLQKSDHSDPVKKNQYQVTQLLSNVHLKESLDIISQYAGFCQLDGLSFLDALRAYLNHFVLENDPDKIDWVLKGFTKRYYALMKKKEQGKKGESKRKEHFETSEAVHMLAFTSVMLDIELRQMNDQDLSFEGNERTERELGIKDGFWMNLAYVNGGENFNRNWIEEIYENIKRKKVIRLVDQNYNEQIEKSITFRLEGAKLVVLARRNSKREKRLAKDYLLYFEGPICLVVKMIGELTELKGIFVLKGCKVVRVKDRKIKFKRINQEDKEEIHFAKFKQAGNLVVSLKPELMLNVETAEDVMKMQKYLESINM